MTKRWVRYAVPVMVEVDCDEDRLDRDDSGHLLFYDENFARQRPDGPIGEPTAGRAAAMYGERA